MRRICVFCASSMGRQPRFAEVAAEVGRLLAARGIGLVYGGGDIGLMGVCADAALAAGGEVVGVIPRGLEEKEVAHRGLTTLHVTDNMHARKQLMHELSDGFLTLPGGFGTLDELFETLTWAQLGIHDKPVGLLDVDGFYTPLLAFLDRQVEAEVLKPEYRALVWSEPVIGPLLDRMVAAFGPALPPPMFPRP